MQKLNCLANLMMHDSLLNFHSVFLDTLYYNFADSEVASRHCGLSIMRQRINYRIFYTSHMHSRLLAVKLPCVKVKDILLQCIFHSYCLFLPSGRL
jgi:hypothetical protein